MATFPLQWAHNSWVMWYCGEKSRGNEMIFKMSQDCLHAEDNFWLETFHMKLWEEVTDRSRTTVYGQKFLQAVFPTSQTRIIIEKCVEKAWAPQSHESLSPGRTCRPLSMDLMLGCGIHLPFKNQYHLLHSTSGFTVFTIKDIAYFLYHKSCLQG